MGIRSRIKWTWKGSPRRSMPRLTSVPRGPLSSFMTRLLSSSGPEMASPSTATMRSPARMPALSEGPPGMAATTIRVSCWIKNSTPMPSKFPSMFSDIEASSSPEKYTVWGSNSSNMASMATSTSRVRSKVSTYKSSMRCKTFMSRAWSPDPPMCSWNDRPRGKSWPDSQAPQPRPNQSPTTRANANPNGCQFFIQEEQRFGPPLGSKTPNHLGPCRRSHTPPARCPLGG